MKGYKGFNSQLQCTPQGKVFPYEVGQTYTHNGAVILCSQGFHFCGHPRDTWSYYRPNDGSRYAEIEADEVLGKTADDTKRVARSLTVKAELKIPALVKAAVEFVFAQVKSSPTVSATTGTSAHSATTGSYAHSVTTGKSAHSAVAGKQCIAAALGGEGQAKGIIGSWLVLAEWRDGKIKAMGIARVDGKKIKADTFYTLKGGKFVEGKGA